MSVFHIYRTKKPVSKNEPELVGRTTDPERAFQIADQTNRSEIKTAHLPDQNGAQGVQGNREITKVFTTEELKAVNYPGTENYSSVSDLPV